MKSIRLAWLELRRLRGRLLALVPIVLVLVPLLYGALYLWSNWDPYGKLNRVPVAVVNSDQPVERNGELINAGEQFVDQLKTTDTFDWHFVRPAEARRGLEHGNYYFTIQVPRDFSTKLATASRTAPEHASLMITKNDANGYIAGIMADTARAELQNQINSAAHAAYAHALYRELNLARDKLQLASEASHEMVRGTALGKQGAGALTKGLSGARDGSSQIAQGVQNISEATAQLDDKLTEVTDFGAQQLPDAVNALVNASNASVNSLGAISTGTAVVQQGAARGAGSVQDLGERYPQLQQDRIYQRALDDARTLADTTAKNNADAHQALSTAQEANSEAVTMQNNIGPLQDRIRAISTPANLLRTGTSQLAGGTDGVTSGLNSLVSGSSVLQSGTGQLNDGSKRLSNLITDSLRRIPPTSPTQVAQAAEVLGSPTNIKTDNLNPAHVYGRGLAPFFFSIALWVFGLIAYLLLKPVNLRALGGRVNPLTIAVAGWLPAAALGVIGGMLLFGVVDLGLGLNPVHLLPTLGMIALAAGTFVAIDHFLRTALGSVGALLSLVLLIVQLTASGGLYPMETAPLPFQVVHPFLPMTYLVNALRVAISGGLTDQLARDAVVLGSCLVVFLALTTLVVWRQRVWNVRRLHPQLEL